MKASTEEFLYVLLWTADTFLRPTWQNLNDGFEAWGWRNGLGRRLAQLQRQQLLETTPADLPHAFVRLTHAGRLAVLGGRDPDAQWARPWDGQWRMVLFDIPTVQDTLHVRLWRNLRRHGFGFLQNSVWITPDPVDRERLARTASVPSVEMIIVIQGRPAAGETDADIVTGAWDFDGLNAAYRSYLDFLRHAPAADANRAALRHWLQAERAAWAHAVRGDPFLPEPLWPRGYLGRTAWRQRTQTVPRVVSLIRHTATVSIEN